MEGQKEQNGRTGQKEHVRLEFESCSKNEEFARVVAAVFMSRLDPTLEETQDVKTAAVSYTHLDVYKRQVEYRTARWQKNEGGCVRQGCRADEDGDPGFPAGQ